MANYNAMATDSGTDYVPNIGYKYYNDYVKEEIWVSGEKKYKYYRPGGTMEYWSYEDYKTSCDIWGKTRADTLYYAKMVNRCHDLELGCGLLYKMFGDVFETLGYTTDMVGRAQEELDDINEKAINNAKKIFGKFIEDTAEPKTICWDIRENLDSVNSALKNAGEHYTYLHDKSLDLYSLQGSFLGIPIEDFSNER